MRNVLSFFARKSAQIIFCVLMISSFSFFRQSVSRYPEQK